MSEDTVTRVRVVDAWAVKTASGQYLDAGAVRVVNALLVLLLVGLGVFWLVIALLQAYSEVIMYSALNYVNPLTILVAVWNFVCGVAHLWVVGLVVRHDRQTIKTIGFGGLLICVGAVGQYLLDGLYYQLPAIVGYVVLIGLSNTIVEYYRGA